MTGVCVEIQLDEWAQSILADPITKLPKNPTDFTLTGGIIDARITLANTTGFIQWHEGQQAFESLEETKYYVRKPQSHFESEILHDTPVYEHLKLEEPILDVGGSIGLLREFLPSNCKYIVVDPFIDVAKRISPSRKSAYKCLDKPLNFVAALAEFLPIQSNSVKTVHMRSMLDHVQVVDLCLLEAKRVLVDNGTLIVGITIEGKPYGASGVVLRPLEVLKTILKRTLATVGFKRFKDEHVWHPTYSNLIKVITDAGFTVGDVYWQPVWKGKVVYVTAKC
jgi:ubiquinone/menaquinone biosynthesis C-methylase UbiE